MYCTRCGHRNQPGAFYCTNCNTPLEEPNPFANNPNPVPNQYPYSYPPPYNVPGDPSRDWAGIAGLVCGIISVLCCGGILGALLSACGITFGALGLNSTKRGLAIAGLVCGIVGAIFALGVLILY